ncbi:MAG: malto-oligosyltrehalose synthase [Dongiaceae bacterium]
MSADRDPVAALRLEPAEAAAVPRPPRATYRLQFNAGFTFADAAALLPYLDALGVSHVYASPYLKARPGSTHGYDIVAHDALNPEIGDAAAFDRFCGALAARGMGQILDFVPNHMGIGKGENAWWFDVLEWGPDSRHAGYFDIEWAPRQPWLRGKVLLPVLGEAYGAVLERGELALRFDPESGSFAVAYFDRSFPISPRHYGEILRRGLPAAERPERLDELAAAFAALGPRSGRAHRAGRDRQAGALKRQLADLAAAPGMAARLGAAAEAYAGRPGEPGSFLPLHQLLDRQCYRLAHWRTAADAVNYRRFFDIADLAGIRVEEPELFERSHRLIAAWIGQGRLHGLRIDHIDGLYDPEDYCRRLRALVAERGGGPGFTIHVEKILARHERLRESWPVDGTTGYEVMNLLNGVLVDPAGERPLDRAWHRFLGEAVAFDDILRDAKALVVDHLLGSELNVLANALDRLSESHWLSRDFTMERLHRALRAVVIAFPVYRTYVSPRGTTTEDRRDIDWAVVEARRRCPEIDGALFDFLHDALTADLAGRGSYGRSEVLRFAMKLQQYTGPVMAKALEDTSFYRYARLLSLNEVGGDPRQFAVSLAAFHHANRERARRWPNAMLATATHDSKRGEDVRPRLDLLSELPGDWAELSRRWATLNRFARRRHAGRRAPSRRDEYLIYQTLLGAWPNEEGALDDFAERIAEYLVKALREAKQRTGWARPDEGYEAACIGFARRLLQRDRSNPFLDSFLPFQRRVAALGALGSLVQTTLKLTIPGLPDLYRGSELWDLTLVDPDNRRPVDFARHAALLDEVRAVGERPAPERPAALAALLAGWPDGRIKLHLIWRLLALRRERPALLAAGDYQPLAATGPRQDQVIAFGRRLGEARLVVVAGRFFTRLADEAGRYEPVRWADTVLPLAGEPPGPLTELLTGRLVRPQAGEGLRLAELLDPLPVAVLSA